MNCLRTWKWRWSTRLGRETTLSSWFIQTLRGARQWFIICYYIDLYWCFLFTPSNDRMNHLGKGAKDRSKWTQGVAKQVFWKSCCRKKHRKIEYIQVNRQICNYVSRTRYVWQGAVCWFDEVSVRGPRRKRQQIGKSKYFEIRYSCKSFADGKDFMSCAFFGTSFEKSSSLSLQTFHARFRFWRREQKKCGRRSSVTRRRIDTRS